LLISVIFYLTDQDLVYLYYVSADACINLGKKAERFASSFLSKVCFGKDDILSYVQGGEAELDVPEPVHHAEAGNPSYHEVRSYFGLHLHIEC
jgi:hypothetical protein